MEYSTAAQIQVPANVRSVFAREFRKGPLMRDAS